MKQTEEIKRNMKEAARKTAAAMEVASKELQRLSAAIWDAAKELEKFREVFNEMVEGDK